LMRSASVHSTASCATNFGGRPPWAHATDDF
jgi:hypothetical protein